MIQKYDSTSRRTRVALVRLTALVCLLAGMLWLVLARAGSAQAGGVVTDCSNDSDFKTKMGGGGLVTFNCNLPAPIVITVTASGGVVPAADTTVDGSNNGNPITLSGGHANRLFQQVSAGVALTLTHLTLSDGNAGSNNGGCLLSGGTAVLIDVTVIHCAVAVGNNAGGLFNNGGVLTLIDSRVISNTATAGGGIYSDNSGTLTLVNTVVSDNRASGDSSLSKGGGLYVVGSATISNSQILNNVAQVGGGGIYNNATTVTLTATTLNGNSAGGFGGGIFNDISGALTVNNSTLSGNSAPYGGGIHNLGIATLNNSTLSGNPASTVGGGIYNVNIATLNIYNSTLSDNSAPSGGALYLELGATTVLTNSILAYSPAPGNCSGMISASIYSISSDNTCALTGTVQGMNPNGLDPLLSALGNYGGPTLVHMLKQGSPAIDGAVGIPAVATDQRGMPRSTDGNYDIGAVERQPTDTDLPPRSYLPLIWKPVPTLDHIFVVIEENHGYTQIIGSAAAPYINSLATQNSLATNYFAIRHPSLPNYLTLVGGDTFGITTDCNPDTCPVSAANLSDRIESAGKTWRAYMDSMGAPCGTSDSYPYAVRHNPFVYFDDIRTNSARCSSHDVPYSQLAADLSSAATTPNFVWITPNVCNDMHDCLVTTGDTWLQNNLPAIFNSPAWTTQNSVLFLLFDEDDNSGGNNHIPAVIVGPAVKSGFQSAVRYDHYSWLHTVETLWGLPTLTANDAAATVMTDIWR